jgi:hypothetical protein
MNRKLSAGKVRYWVLLWLAALSPAYSYEMHWGYEGAAGPSHWGDIKPEFATCKTGMHQSPINIVGAQRTELPPLKLDYRPTPLDVVNNGHTIQVNVEPGSTFATGDRAYRLMQVAAHSPDARSVRENASRSRSSFCAHGFQNAISRWRQCSSTRDARIVSSRRSGRGCLRRRGARRKIPPST